jgi:hypothetical protein
MQVAGLYCGNELCDITVEDGAACLIDLTQVDVRIGSSRYLTSLTMPCLIFFFFFSYHPRGPNERTTKFASFSNSSETSADNEAGGMRIGRKRTNCWKNLGNRVGDEVGNLCDFFPPILKSHFFLLHMHMCLCVERAR